MKVKLKTTSILDSHGKIGPFFLKEALVIGFVLFVLGFTMMILGSYFQIRSIVVFMVPFSFLSLVTISRYFFTKELTSPWYIQNWIALRLIWPKSILADSPSFKTRKDAK